MSDITVFTLFQEILTDLGATQSTLTIYALVYKILYNSINLLIGIFIIINTVFAFTDQSAVLRQIFQVINLVLASGLLGNFGARQTDANSQIANVNYVIKNLITTMGTFGFAAIPQPVIMGTFTVSAIQPYNIQSVQPVIRSRNEARELCSLVVKPIIRTKLVSLQVLIDSHRPP